MATISIWQLQFCDDERDGYVITPVELQEIRYPALVGEHALREDSGGAGQHRGDLGVRITYHTQVPPWGHLGSESRARNVAVVSPADAPEQANANYGWRVIT